MPGSRRVGWRAAEIRLCPKNRLTLMLPIGEGGIGKTLASYKRTWCGSSCATSAASSATTR